MFTIVPPANSGATCPPPDRGWAAVRVRLAGVARVDADARAGVDIGRGDGGEREVVGGFGHVEHAFDVQPPHRPPALRHDQLGGAEELAAGVVDEQVELSAALEHLADHAPGIVALADVALDDAHVPHGDSNGRGDLLGGLREHVGAASGDRHRGAAARELERGGLTQAGSAACHECNLAREHPGREDGGCATLVVHRGG